MSPGPWRVGRKVGRTIYDVNDKLIGVMDTIEDAQAVVVATKERDEVLACTVRLSADLNQVLGRAMAAEKERDDGLRALRLAGIQIAGLTAERDEALADKAEWLQLYQAMQDERDRLRAAIERLEMVVLHMDACRACGEGPACEMVAADVVAIAARGVKP